MGREVRTELEVTACDPPRRFEVRSRGGRVRYRIAHTLEPREGRTALHVAVDVEVGSMMRIAAQGPLKMAEREFRQDFERLKEILQSRPISDS
jgi:carbon monoxide dehydrogenase subunit G